MSDTRPSFDEERMPWLREVEDEDAPGGISAGKMLVALLVVLVIAAAVAGTFFWLGHRNAGDNGQPELIRAPQAPYKVKPPTVGGLDVAGESQTTFETSAGQNVSGQLDTSKLSETQAVAPPPPPPPKTPPKPQATASEPPSTPAADASAGPTDGSVVQLGAYKNTAQAERAWLALTSRFPQLSGNRKMVVPYSAGGSSGYRLRAAASSPADAKALCDALQAGGEGCFIAK
jgi:type IV secretory pathway VirB10-like protein